MQTLLDELENLPDGDVDIDLEKLQYLLMIIGQKFVSKDIYNDGLNIKSMYKNCNDLKSLNSMAFLSNRDQLLLSFLNGCSTSFIKIKQIQSCYMPYQYH